MFLLAAALSLVQAACMADSPPPPNLRAPESFTVLFDTSRGPITIDLSRSNAPIGVDRFYSMVKSGYLDGARFFRVVPGFVVQFGISGNPALNKVWTSPIKDDPSKRGNKNLRGTVVFASTEDPDSRTTQLFFNLADNTMLDRQGFVPIGKVSKGMEVVDRFFSGYGEDPDQGLILSQGDAYLSKSFPSLDFIKSATITAPAASPSH